ncbi:hypothetical protein [Aeromicrobium sp. CTD01-1L150]|uniref:hypothetical protein n=1 Tax=Aeromicrobium sp. CTD01-1L150 TaxID=3341830 RepID=UPI0035C0AEF5
MSCVGFFTPEQLRRVREAAADPRPVSTFASPDVTPAKVARVEAMAGSGDVRVRESAGLSYVAQTDVLQKLAGDAETSVRCCVARNERTPGDVLERLSTDADAGVRGWVAANPVVPDHVLDALAGDEDVTVRAVVEWAKGWD